MLMQALKTQPVFIDFLGQQNKENAFKIVKFFEKFQGGFYFWKYLEVSDDAKNKDFQPPPEKSAVNV